VRDCEGLELGVVPEPQLLQHGTAMGIDGIDADVEVLGDLAVGHATREHLHHLRFASRERARLASARRISAQPQRIRPSHDLASLLHSR